ncbi:MAG: Glutamine--scyllo-inositol transaminase [Candidatus Kaiserbacteria bacterium]|nr:Glutamine--scyllo-inositol transaminase [Candidatus Kaiserbacteria bacterium]
MNVPFVDLAWQESQIKTEREKRFADVIERTAFVMGPEVEQFEEHFAAYCGVKHAIAVANGTDALMLIYAAAGIGPGDEVITIATTFIASVSPLLHLGASPVFVDIDPTTRNFDMEKIETAITPKTKAILAVHLYGDMPDMDALKNIADKHKVMIIEDACQAHGAEYKGERAGSFGIAAAFSFYPGKNLGAYGDGGGITTNDDDVAARLRMLRNHGGVKKYEHAIVGFNSRLDTLHAIVLDEKLKLLDSWNEMRRSIAEAYEKGLSDITTIKIPARAAGVQPVHHLYMIELPEGERDPFMNAMRGKGIGVGIHYPDPLHLTGALSGLGYKKGDLPHAETFASRIVSIPMFPGMTAEQVTYVVSSIREYFHV